MKDAGETNKNKLTLTDKTEIKNTTGLVWFGNDLRIHDNDVLSLAIKNHSKVIGTYIIDPLFFKENEFGFDTIGYKGYEDPPQILDMIKKYIDHNKMFEQAMSKKIGMFYQALNWGGVEDVTTSMNRFF